MNIPLPSIYTHEHKPRIVSKNGRWCVGLLSITNPEKNKSALFWCWQMIKSGRYPGTQFAGDIVE